jgi:predicted membrane channel-forming protein YqfA (hemolysin III family)
MGALSTANALNDMDAQRWFVVLTNAAYLGTAWMCLKRFQWIRALAFVYVAGSSAWYHLEVNTYVLDPTKAGCDADRIGAYYAILSVVLLFAHIPSQTFELVIEILLICVVVPVVLLKDVFEDWVVLVSAIALILTVCIPSWVVYGQTPHRPAWLAAASLCATGAIIIRMTEHDNDMWQHGFWHIFTALAAFCAVYSLRDPNLLPGYTLLRDVL